jgi:pimeloyl-ACP methyl ester carboxylesterase/DNA-binding CsgD family transcriptional regulator
VGSHIGATTQSTGLAVEGVGGLHPISLRNRVERHLMAVLTRRMEQEIRFCSAPDGVQLAYATHGYGSPLVRAGTWLTHLEFDWASPLWRHWLAELGRDFRMIRYDERGCGLSDRDVMNFSLDAWVSDLETVVDDADLNRFVLLGVSGGGPIAITYALRHPERVSHLVLYGSYSRARRARNDPDAVEQEDALIGMIKVGWGGVNPAFRRVFTTLFVPDATAEQMRWFDEIQQRSTSAGNAIALRQARSRIDVSAAAREIDIPTLVLHANEDAVVPFDEGRRLAGLIRGARFVPLEGRNHILLEHELAWQQFVKEVRAFARAVSGRELRYAGQLDQLSRRELEVLRLVAMGKSNLEIADTMFLSERTVERHMSNIYAKLRLTGKAARAAAAAILTAAGDGAERST